MATPRAKKATTPKVDPTVVNQEDPVVALEERPSTESKTEDKVVEVAPANDVDETVRNQESPVISEKARPSTDENADKVDEVVKVAPANDVDDVVVNQENPGAGEFVDRNPEPQIVEDSVGVQFDISKSYPELMTDDPDAGVRKARVRQEQAVLNAKDIEDGNDEEVEKHDHINLYFLESGLTAQGRVWKAGQTLVLEDNEDTRRAQEDIEGNVWYELSASEQKDRYGKVFFEKR